MISYMQNNFIRITEMYEYIFPYSISGLHTFLKHAKNFSVELRQKPSIQFIKMQLMISMTPYYRKYSNVTSQIVMNVQTTGNCSSHGDV